MKKPKMQGLVMVAALAVATFVSASDDVQKVVVSTDAYNRLVFPEPYSTIVIPPRPSCVTTLCRLMANVVSSSVLQTKPTRSLSSSSCEAARPSR